MPKALKPGTRVRAKARTGSGWMGTGTVVRQHGTIVTLVKDGYPLENPFEGMADMVVNEIAVLKDQNQPHIENKLDLVMHQWPELTYPGFFVPEYRESPADQIARKAADRDRMLTEDALEQFNRSVEFIIAELGMPVIKGKPASSYYLKHRAEEWIATAGAADYVSNGMFIAAAISEGFKPRQITGLNCNFAVDPPRMRQVHRKHEQINAADRAY